MAGAQRVRIRETARDNQYLEVLPALLSVTQLVYVDDFRQATRQLNGLGYVVVAIGAVSVQDQGFRLHGCLSSP